MRSLSSSIAGDNLFSLDVNLVDLITRRLIEVESLICHIERPAIRTWINLNGSLGSTGERDDFEFFVLDIIPGDTPSHIE